MTIPELAVAIAQQELTVEVMGMGNVTQLTTDERLKRVAAYEIEKARLVILREDLVAAMRLQTRSDEYAGQSLGFANGTVQGYVAY